MTNPGYVHGFAAEKPFDFRKFKVTAEQMAAALKLAPELGEDPDTLVARKSYTTGTGPVPGRLHLPHSMAGLVEAAADMIDEPVNRVDIMRVRPWHQGQWIRDIEVVPVEERPQFAGHVVMLWMDKSTTYRDGADFNLTPGWAVAQPADRPFGIRRPESTHPAIAVFGHDTTLPKLQDYPEARDQ
jgi:hypothetical protein